MTGCIYKICIIIFYSQVAKHLRAVHNVAYSIDENIIDLGIRLDVDVQKYTKKASRLEMCD